MKNNITYNSDWKKLSKKILEERTKCELCQIRGLDNKSEEVHHCIKPDQQLEVGLGDLLLLDPDNLVAVCKNHHNAIHKQPWKIFPEMRNFLDAKKYNICDKYLKQGKIVMWTNDLHSKVRKQKSFIEAPVFK